MAGPVYWVVGRGGLLGASTAQALGRVGELWIPRERFAWGDQWIDTQVEAEVGRFAAHVAGDRWGVAWCAGAGVVASDRTTLERESGVLAALLRALGTRLEAHELGEGSLFFASSAGGLYAGSTEPPFHEGTVPVPISPYGQSKLSQENHVRSWSATRGVPVLVGRIANLYGPGQNLSKPQGLISQLCWAALLQRPLNIYVPLATMRDYLYAPDCGSMIADGLPAVAEDEARAGRVTVAVLASQRPMSIGAVLGEFRRVIRRNPRVSLQISPLGRHQVLDLRLTSQGGLTPRGRTTPLPVGLHATFHDLRQRYAVR